MKKFVSMLLFMSVFFTMFAAVGQAAAVVPKLYLNGQLLKSDIDPQIINDFTVVPVRTISEGLGYQISWDNTTKTATVQHGANVIKLKLNDQIALVNDQPVQMDTQASIVKGTTLIPLRFVGEQFGLYLEYKQAEKEVHMLAKPTEPEQPPVPVEPTGKINQVTFDGTSSLKISYEGYVKPNKPLYLEDPKRIVLDFPNVGYSDNLSSLFLGGEVKNLLFENTWLQSFRYSQFSDSPLTARLVLDINEDTGVVVTENAFEIRIDFMAKADVPVDPNAPIKPPVIVVPPVVIPEIPVTDGVYDVVIDPGHGGSDPGAKSVLNRWEKEFNLSLALKMKALLGKESKIRVHLTRTGDTYPSLGERVEFAEKLKADMFISIHANSAARLVTGTETFYYRENSKALANLLHKRLLAGTRIKDRGVKKVGYKVIKDTTMPAILLEAGFLSNTSDSKMLFSNAAQNRIAAELTAGIKDYFKVK